MAERLRIALIAPIAGPTALDRGSSIEYLTALLAEELARRGHRVTLFATGDSRTSAALHATYSRGYEHDGGLWNWEFHEIMHAAAAFERAAEFDLIHSHAYHSALPFTRLVPIPVVHTYHIVPDDDVLACYARYPEVQLVAVSQWHAGTFAGAPRLTVVPNGVDVAAFPFGAGGDDLLFLGHLIPKKGAAEAIHVARRAGRRLVMAGRARPDRDGGYFRAEIEPHLDGRNVAWVGPVAVPERNALLAGAAALLFPSTTKEPFGLVMIEAMACGTPVAALDRCAVREVVEPGVSGIWAADVDRLAARLPEAIALDRAGVRRAVAARFDGRRMVDAYEALYRRLVAERAGAPFRAGAWRARRAG